MSAGASTRLEDFTEALGALMDETPPAAVLLPRARALLKDLVAHDDWLPDEFARPDPRHYQQYLLYRDPAARFTVVAFVWGPSQATPIHDHTVWGLVGVLRGAELTQRYARSADGLLVRVGERYLLNPGDVDVLSVEDGDIHQVLNAHDDRVSISIHVYGGDIGRIERSIYGKGRHVRPFISGYSNPTG